MGDEATARTRKAIFEGLRRNVCQKLEASLEAEKEANDQLAGTAAIVQAMREGRIQCRVYAKRKFHAKAYITHPRVTVIGSVALVGSSNFTVPGLTENVELNIQIRAPGDVSQLQAWYEQHWQEAEELTPEILQVIQRHLDEYTPFEVYAKALQELFEHHAPSEAEWENGASRIYHALAEVAQVELTAARNELGLIPDPANAEKVAELDHGLKEMAWGLAHIRDARKRKAADQDEALERLRARFDNPQKPTFVWQLDFAEVFHRDSVAADVSRRTSTTGELSLPAAEASDQRGLTSAATSGGGFDLFVGNPPYVRIQVLNQAAPEQVAWFKQHYTAAGKGNYDLYVVFVERSLHLLAPRGQLAFILPHKFFNAQYGAPLRKLLADGKHLRHVVHFGDQQVFPGATNYVCLLFLAKAGANACRWMRAEDLPDWLATQSSPEAQLPATRLTAAEWNFAVGQNAGLFERLQAMPVKLGALAERISQGIRTSANEVYVLDVVGERGGNVTAVSKQLEKEVVLERKAVSNFLAGREIKAYSIRSSGKVAIIPYEFRQGKSVLIPIGEMGDRFPKAAAYLRANKGFLAGREEERMQGVGWHGFIYPKNLEVMASPKLLVPDIADRTAFAYAEQGEFTFTSGYGITIKSGVKESPKYLLGLLNSRLLDWFWKRVSTPLRGGFYRYFTQFIEQLPIRPINFGVASERAEHDALVGLVERILAAKRAAPAADTSALERAIDERVYRLYALISDEINLLEENTT